MLLYQLAEHLHQPVRVIEQLDFDELAGWVAYFNIKRRKARD